MNSLTQVLMWCPIQVTVLAIAALAIGALAGRRRPAAGAVVAAAALLAVAAMTAMAFSPWPDWKISWERLARDRDLAVNNGAQEALAPSAAIKPSLSQVSDSGVDLRPIEGLSQPEESAPSWLTTLGATLASNWMTAVLLLYVVGVSAMALRIGLGLLTVRGYRRHSHPVTDRTLGELADVVCAQLGCKTGIELRETTQLNTPATIGWLRPMLLLPVDWRTWTADERHAVLAHEIEHVRRQDFASWIAAQVGVALHFYHPLVHWLASRLRLQQELAADAAAARVVGGQRKYVTTLAAMALRQADAPVAWPARAFLPNSKTFLRRIEMLHRSKSLRGDVSRPVVFLTVAAVVLTAACAAGLRGSVAGDDSATAKRTTQFTLAFNQEGESKVTTLEVNPAQRRAWITREVNQLKQLALAMHNYHDKHKHFPPAVVMGPDGTTPHSWRVELLPFLDELALYKQYRMDEPWDSEANKKVLEQMPAVLRSPFDDPRSTNSSYYVLVGPGTVFEGPKGISIQDITDGTSNTLMIVASKRNIPWTKPADIPFDAKKPMPELGGFVKGQFTCAIADGSVRSFTTDQVKEHLDWLIVRDDHRALGMDAMGPDPNSAAGMQQRRVARKRPQGKGAQARNNLKQLGLAMHNYHDVHGHFPPAIVMGPDGKTPHSWRVELLPFLDAAGLYKQYDQTQPWDSEGNKKVLAQMPSVFRSPYDDPKTDNSGYYVLVGPGTIFEIVSSSGSSSSSSTNGSSSTSNVSNGGIKIADITDGTSNTLLVVETKRNIPWTKPEDIAFDPEKPLPELGGFIEGGFNCALADGSARTLETSRLKDDLKWLIMRNDGHPITRQ